MLRIALVCLAGLLATTDVTGTWSATAETRFPSGKVETHPLVFVFAQSGAVLTGSVGPDGKHQLPIDHGRVTNDTLKFDCKWGNGALVHFLLVPTSGGLQGTGEGDAAQVPKDPGPDFTNTFYLTLKRSE
jgi:hypothetical protein